MITRAIRSEHKATACRPYGSLRPAASLVELLVVISVILFLLALLVPGLSGARERGRRMVCANNLRQWGFALQCYRDENDDYLPKEGTYLAGGILVESTWYNALPPYLSLPPYRDLEGANEAIRELPNIHVWICPSKNITGAFKSGTGKNQFHYAMNQVLDGLGDAPDGSRDTPGFPDERDRKKFLPGKVYRKKPHTVFMFDIYPNSPAGTPRSVATMYQRYRGRPVGKFHGDYANILYLSGSVGNCSTDDLVTDRDFRHGDIVWDNPRLYWGYPPP